MVRILQPENGCQFLIQHWRTEHSLFRQNSIPILGSILKSDKVAIIGASSYE